jgi:hypothetical protein
MEPQREMWLEKHIEHLVSQVLEDRRNMERIVKGIIREVRRETLIDIERTVSRAIRGAP